MRPLPGSAELLRFRCSRADSRRAAVGGREPLLRVRTRYLPPPASGILRPRKVVQPFRRRGRSGQPAPLPGRRLSGNRWRLASPRVTEPPWDLRGPELSAGVGDPPRVLPPSGRRQDPHNAQHEHHGREADGQLLWPPGFATDASGRRRQHPSRFYRGPQRRGQGRSPSVCGIQLHLWLRVSVAGPNRGLRPHSPRGSRCDRGSGGGRGNRDDKHRIDGHHRRAPRLPAGGRDGRCRRICQEYTEKYFAVRNPLVNRNGERPLDRLNHPVG